MREQQRQQQQNPVSSLPSCTPCVRRIRVCNSPVSSFSPPTSPLRAAPFLCNFPPPAAQFIDAIAGLCAAVHLTRLSRSREQQQQQPSTPKSHYMRSEMRLVLMKNPKHTSDSDGKGNLPPRITANIHTPDSSSVVGSPSGTASGHRALGGGNARSGNKVIPTVPPC